MKQKMREIFEDLDKEIELEDKKSFLAFKIGVSIE